MKMRAIRTVSVPNRLPSQIREMLIFGNLQKLAAPLFFIVLNKARYLLLINIQFDGKSTCGNKRNVYRVVCL